MYRKTFSLKIIFLTLAFVASFGICFASEGNNTVQSENKKALKWRAKKMFEKVCGR